MTSVVSHAPETNEGIVTSWIPITSAWPVVAECATGGIYSQIGPEGVAIADDPYYGININRSLTCLPPAATLWWDQSTTFPLLTHTSLGPFVCPGDYTTATTSVVNNSSTFVGCCPSDYTFETTKDSGTLGQCNSPLSVGQVMTYINLTSGPQTASATISADGASVYAVHVNGYVFAASSTTTTSLSGTLLSATGAGSTTSPTSSATISSASSPSTGSLSIGVKAGIGVGVGLGVLGLCSLFVTFCLIQRRWKKAGIPDYSVNVSSPTLYSAIPKGNDKPLPVAAKEERYEMWQPTNEHELG